jgi:hypothetical protein
MTWQAANDVQCPQWALRSKPSFRTYAAPNARECMHPRLLLGSFLLAFGGASATGRVSILSHGRYAYAGEGGVVLWVDVVAVCDRYVGGSWVWRVCVGGGGGAQKNGGCVS